MSEQKVILNHTKTTCKHCGEPCEAEAVENNGNSFCCQGCQLVYELIQENDLGDFYNLNQKAGISQKANNEKAFDYLKDEQYADSLLVFKNNSISKISLYLPAIHCSACIWLLEKLYKLHSGIAESRVDFNQKIATITFKHEEISLFELAKLLKSIGYTPTFEMEGQNKKILPTEKFGCRSALLALHLVTACYIACQSILVWIFSALQEFSAYSPS